MSHGKKQKKSEKKAVTSDSSATGNSTFQKAVEAARNGNMVNAKSSVFTMNSSDFSKAKRAERKKMNKTNIADDKPLSSIKVNKIIASDPTLSTVGLTNRQLLQVRYVLSRIPDIDRNLLVDFSKKPNLKTLEKALILGTTYDNASKTQIDPNLKYTGKGSELFK